MLTCSFNLQSGWFDGNVLSNASVTIQLQKKAMLLHCDFQRVNRLFVSLSLLRSFNFTVLRRDLDKYPATVVLLKVIPLKMCNLPCEEIIFNAR